MSIAIHTLSPRMGNLHIQGARKPVSSLDRVRVNARNIIRKQGVSALLSFWNQELAKRPTEAQEICWNALLPIARALVWEQYVRYGETLEVGYELDTNSAGVLSPFIWAAVTTLPGAGVEWYIDPSENLYNNWNWGVRG